MILVCDLSETWSMAEVDFLICGGSYNDAERDALFALRPAIYIRNIDEIDALSQIQRDAIRAVAYRIGIPFTKGKMQMLPNLKLIANYGVGYDTIDVEGANNLGIHITNTPDVLNDCVADLAVGMALSLSRCLYQGENFIRTEEWAQTKKFPLNHKFSGKKAGIVGLGRIGREIAERLVGFKMEIHYHSRRDKSVSDWKFHADIISLAKEVDYLFIALVGGNETQNYISREVISALGEKGMLINIARGSVIDEEALIIALQNKEIVGAALDVFNHEPKIDKRFYHLDNVLLQPHQGSGTFETRAAMAKLQRDNILAFFNGSSLLTSISNSYL